MKLIRRISLLFLFILPQFASAISKEERTHISDSLYRSVPTCHTPGDSLQVYLNLYDLLPRGEGNRLVDTLINVAMRAGQPNVALDIIRNDVNRNMSNDTLREARLEFVRRTFPKSDARQETETFIKMISNMRAAMYSDMVDRTAMLEKLKQQFDNNPPTDLHGRIVLLHGICMILSQDNNTKMLTQYIDSLGVLINQLPATAISIRNAYNIHAASAYLDTYPEKALEADRRSLNDITRLQNYYAKQGRIYRRYEATQYVIYTRMLSCYPDLSDNDFYDIYRKAVELGTTDPDASVRYEAYHEPDLYKAAREQDWATAYPLLNNIVGTKAFDSLSTPRQIRMLRNYIKASQAMNDEKGLLRASLRLNDYLDREMKFRTQGLYREIRLAYADYDMRRHYNDLEVATLKSRNRLTSIVTILSIIGLVLMSTFIVMLLVQYRKMRIMAKSLKISNAKLKKESENLKTAQRDLVRARDSALKANALKSDFIKNLSYEIKIPLQAINEYSKLIADCADPNTKEYLGRFTDLIDYNGELLTTIINDALHLSQLESDTMPVQKQIVSLRTLCQATIDTLQRRNKNTALKLQLAENLPDIQINTDQSRLQQILQNLLINAIKFTEKGTITLGYEVDEENGKVSFYVADTGIGINPENSEKIFDRFVKLDPNVQGAGLGLTISRMLARLLGGTLVLDSSYTGGARFVLTLPR